MDLVKVKSRVLVLSLIPQGGKPKDAVELVFRNTYLHPQITERLLEEGYTMTAFTDERDIMVDARYADYERQTALGQTAPTKKPAPRRKSTPKKVVAPKEEEVLELTPEPIRTPAKKAKKAPAVASTDDVIIED